MGYVSSDVFFFFFQNVPSCIADEWNVSHRVTGTLEGGNFSYFYIYKVSFTSLSRKAHCTNGPYVIVAC